ncbi:IS66 family insertion sequence element accessory protein TnpB [Ligilactobacillus acidipiscis]|uniref:IS66 family insertion sequence element accessory protein TnpB n=1 Tax=Ligilactobacillus acidipiscis TaxID=89059 RepID=UPI0022E6B439|nr:IS66 family insertion sequence element accessory protein TnpB [Ligilactobacillus acidipiscis]
MTMLDLSQIDRIYLSTGKTDLRKGIDVLVTVITEQFNLDPYQSVLFYSAAAAKTALKGCCGRKIVLYCFRFEDGRLQGPIQAEVRQLQPKQLALLLQGWSIDATIHESDPTHLRLHPKKQGV